MPGRPKTIAPCYTGSMTITDFLANSWTAAGEALIQPPRFSPVIADPSFLFPEETSYGEWELFAHSAWGIHRYSSIDGLAWHDNGLVIRNAMRPFIRRHGREYRLYYEKYRPLALPMTVLPWKPRWHSTVAMSTSFDLKLWSAPQVLVEPEQDWMRDQKLGDSVSNPCVVEAGTGSSVEGTLEWRLYFSASLSYIDDCGFSEPRYIALARGTSPGGPFIPDAAPLIGPEHAVSVGSKHKGSSSTEDLGAGSIKVIRMDDGWIGLQNKIYRDAGGRSRSAIFVLQSDNGLTWLPASDKPLIAPGTGWTGSHVYACDCRYREADKCWYLYFNARDGWKIAAGKERIGRIVGKAQG